jgi:hypothetical protein
MMLKLPKEHLSVSQINLWESDPIAYQKKYFIGIPDPPSPFLEFGKQFAKDIEDYTAGVQRDFNFPEGFLDKTLIYPHVEYKLEYDFGDFKMLGFIDNMSKDYELVIDFKTGTAPWSTQRLQESLQMQTYSLILWYKFGVIPTSIISYWKTKLRGKTLSWAGEHESFMYVFNLPELAATDARIRRVAKEISEAYERYQNSAIGERFFKYAEITKELKELETKKELIKSDLIDLLKDNKMAMDVHGSLVSYSTYQRKSYSFSKNIIDKEYEIEQMKREEINSGVAEEKTKTVTLILVKDEGVE